MTLMEALKTGLPFKRSSAPHSLHGLFWLVPFPSGKIYADIELEKKDGTKLCIPMEENYFTIEEVLAEDWETKNCKGVS